MAYETTTHGTPVVVKFLPYDASSPAYLLEYTMAANDGLLQENAVFRFYVNTRQVLHHSTVYYSHARL